MRIFGFLFLLISNVGFAQSATIACPENSSRKIDQAYRLSSSPEKILSTQIDSISQDSTKILGNNANNKVIISFPEINTLYADFDNLVQIGFTDKKRKRFQLKCDGCDTLYRHPINQNSDWVIRANNCNRITLSVIDRKGKVYSISEIPVLPLPIPTLFLDGKNAQSVLHTVPEQMRVKYDETIPLSVKFIIKRWEIRINSNETFGGYGTAIPDNVHEHMQTVKRGAIAIYFSFIGPMGEQRTVEIFEFDLD